LIHYIDSSAFLKTLVDEPETPALGQFLARDEDVAASELVQTEALRRASFMGLDLDTVMAQLAGVALLSISSAQLRRASLLPAAPGTFLRALDAIHLAALLELGLGTIVTYDQRLAQAAQHLGTRVLSPGRQEGWWSQPGT
jgi:predicted nucleic acid-binding protein